MDPNESNDVRMEPDEVVADLELVDDLNEVQQTAESDELPETERLKADLAEAEKKALMAVADLENFRKRSAKNLQDQLRYAALPLMNDLLEAVDNLNRAVESTASESENSGLVEGVKMVSKQLLEILEKNNCKPIPAVGHPFDPNLHQAVQMQPSEEYPSQTVMQELRRGYQLHDRVIRPSQVFVSKGSVPAE